MENAKRSRPAPKPMGDSRFGSLRSKKSISRRSAAGSDDTESDGEVQTKAQLKKSPSFRKGESGSSSRPPSRPQSRAERKRADSVVSATDKEKDKEKEKPEKSKRKSVAGWMGSLTGRGKKEKTDALMQDRDDDSDSDEAETKSSRSRRQSNSSPTKTKPTSSVNASPVVPSRMLKLPAQRKIAVALHDFNAGSPDELSFKAGDQIAVQNEVLDGWWMGELNGKTGLFPTTYTEIINSSSSSLVSKPPLPARPPAAPSSTTPSGSAESLSTKLPRPTPKWLTSQATGESVASEDDHPFGDHFIASSRSPLNGTFYPESIASSGEDEYEEEDGRRLVQASDDNDGHYDYRTAPASAATSSSRPPLPVRNPSLPQAKRPPPPPPPRRSSTTVNMLQPPLAPGRGLLPSNPSTRSNSTNTSFVSIRNDEGLTDSPFD